MEKEENLEQRAVVRSSINPNFPVCGGNGGGMPIVGFSKYSPLTRLYQIISDSDNIWWLREKYNKLKLYFTRSEREYKVIIGNGGGMILNKNGK